MGSCRVILAVSEMIAIKVGIIDTMSLLPTSPTIAPCSITMSRRIRCRRITLAASLMSVSGVIVISGVLIIAPACVLAGERPLATTRTTMSRSVIMPTGFLSSSMTTILPIAFASISDATCSTTVSFNEVTTGLDITSTTGTDALISKPGN